MLENHDRLDKILHTEAFTGSACGSLAVVLEDVPGSPGSKQPKRNAEGSVVTEKQYCGADCPTLIAEIKAKG